MEVYIIAVAAGIGSLVGACFRVRIMALLWATPILCVLYGAVVFVAPFLKDNETAPELLRTVILRIADISLLIPVLVAGAAGALLASTLMRHVGESEMQASRSRRVNDALHREGRTRQSAAGRLAERTERLSQGRASSAFDKPRTLPIFEVAYEPPAPPEPEVPAPAAQTPNLPTPRPVAPQDNRRDHGRRRSALAGELIFEGGRSVRCTIQDLSVGGARMRLLEPWPEGALTNLIDHTNGLAHDATLRWRAGPIAGVRFTASRDLQSFRAPPPRSTS